jgi:hypothetical protein
MNRLRAWAIVAALMVPASASAQSCAEFSVSPAELQLNYDPFSPVRAERVFNVRVRRLDSRATAVRILLADPDPVAASPVVGLGGPADYDIEWVRDAGRQALAIGGEQPNATNGALITLGRAADGSQNEAFRIRIMAGQDVAASDYYQPLDIRFQCYAGDEPLGPPSVQTDGRVALGVRVAETLRAFVGSAGTKRATIDFGELRPGTGDVTRTLSVTAQSTIPYEIDVRAENGALVRGRAADERIPYTMSLANLPVADGARIACPRTPAPSGQRHVFSAGVTGDVAATVRAGDYRDVVTLTFSPRVGLGGSHACALIAP